jgi:hypothetical protein
MYHLAEAHLPLQVICIGWFSCAVLMAGPL